MMDLMFIENPKTKNRKNFYVNDYNYYNKSSIRMINIKKNQYRNNVREKNLQMQINPMPKMLLSTHDIQLIEKQKKFLENLQHSKPVFQDLKTFVDDNINLSFDSDKQDDHETNNIIENEEGGEEELGELKETKENNEVKESKIKEQSPNKNSGFFITKADVSTNTLNTFNCNSDYFSRTIENDVKNVKLPMFNEILHEKIYKEIKENENNYKDSLQLEHFEKYKYSKTGVEFPKHLNKYEAPKYKGKSKDEEEFFNYKKKIKYPNLIYNKLSSFSEKLNSDLGTISNTYGKRTTRGRFVNNPLLSKYMEMIPVYDIYKDIKFIHNRYVDNKFKYKLLPLTNNKLRNLDRLAERIYKMDHIKNGLNNLLSITSEKKNNNSISVNRYNKTNPI